MLWPMTGLTFLLLAGTEAGVPGTGLTIEAADAAIRTVGALHDDAWNLWSNGDWGDFVHLERAGSYEICVRGFGSPADGSWPAMALSIDGTVHRTVTVNSRVPGDHVFRFDAEPGTHRIAVSFVNDARTATEDRNLYLVGMTVTPVENLPVPTIGSGDAWQAAKREDMARLERDTLARAASDIERHRTREITGTDTGKNSQAHLWANPADAYQVTK